MDKFDQVVRLLPPTVAMRLEELPAEVRHKATEIRLRIGRPPALSLPESAVVLPGGALGEELLNCCFLELCGHSAHSYGSELQHGYFTIPGGCRVGVAGISIVRDGHYAGCNKITSLNIRIARDIRANIPAEVEELLSSGVNTLLVAGSPGSGKTTFLRTLTYKVSELGRTVCVVDERGEILDCAAGCANFPLLCDVLTGCPKAEGILMALRTQKPDYIVLDELGGMEDVEALEKGLCSGVGFLFSMHATDLPALQKRPQFRALQHQGAVDAVLLLGPCAGQIAGFARL